MDRRIDQYLEKHRQEAFLHRRCTWVHFDFFKDGEMVRTETYYIGERGESRRASVDHKHGQPRYRIDD